MAGTYKFGVVLKDEIDRLVTQIMAALPKLRATPSLTLLPLPTLDAIDELYGCYSTSRLRNPGPLLLQGPLVGGTPSPACQGSMYNLRVCLQAGELIKTHALSPWKLHRLCYLWFGLTDHQSLTAWHNITVNIEKHKKLGYKDRVEFEWYVDNLRGLYNILEVQIRMALSALRKVELELGLAVTPGRIRAKL